MIPDHAERSARFVVARETAIVEGAVSEPATGMLQSLEPRSSLLQFLDPFSDGLGSVGSFRQIDNSWRSDLERRFTFDGVSNLYNVARPDYPDPLFDDVAALGHLKAGDTML